MKKLFFSSLLFCLLMDPSSVLDASDGQPLSLFFVYQMFDDLYGLQDDVEPMQMTTKRGTYNAD